MEALFIFMGLLMMSMAYNYDNNIDYLPRYGRHTWSRTQSGRTAFSKMQFSRAPFRTTQFGRTPFRYRFHPRLYSEEYTRKRSAYPSLSPWFRKRNSEITTSDTKTEVPKNPNASLSSTLFALNNNAVKWESVTSIRALTLAVLVFRMLITKQTNAKLVTDETKYPWIARVVNTPTPEDTARAPLIFCSAACLEERIFVTTATCLLNAKVYYTRVYYQDVALQPIAFVLPSKRTKAMFHDLGLIVVNRNFTKPWKKIMTFFMMAKMERADNDNFLWTTKISGGWWNTIVIGYVGEASEQEDLPNVKNSLYELETQSSPFLCNYLYNQNPPDDRFFAPCYSACNLTEYQQNLSKCYTYLAGEGHIVIGRITGKLMGLATWGGHYKCGLNKPPLPVGMATANSLALVEDLECARKITKAPEASERFDTLCQ